MFIQHTIIFVSFSSSLSDYPLARSASNRHTYPTSLSRSPFLDLLEQVGRKPHAGRGKEQNWNGTNITLEHIIEITFHSSFRASECKGRATDEYSRGEAGSEVPMVR